MWVPVPAGANEVGYSIESGGIITIEETITPTSIPNWQKQPWDRNPLQVSRMFAQGVSGGTSNASLWTYTVPAGRLFMLARATCEISRQANASFNGVPQVEIVTGAGPIAMAYIPTNNATYEAFDQLNGNGTGVIAGTTFTGSYSDNDTGGSLIVVCALWGMEFDA